MPLAFGCHAKTIAQKKRAVVTRPFGRELGLYCKTGFQNRDYSGFWASLRFT
jgi:hypothetical protein